jgi:Rrf2 family transcriptional repressor of oqxAB
LRRTDGGIRFSRSANSITRREMYNVVICEKSLWAPRAVPHQCFVSSNVERHFVGLAGNADNAALKALDRQDFADSLAELRILDGSAHA